MTAVIISGRDVADTTIETSLKPRVDALKKLNITPKLIVILIGDHAASASYVRQKEKYATKTGIESEVRRFDETVTETEILDELRQINADEKIHGVIVQLPVPKHISVPKILSTIDPKKDVDGFSAQNIGKLFLKQETLECCTPMGIMRMIAASGTEVAGANAVVVGRSNIVGKPVAMMLLNKNATVTICHSRTKDLAAHTKNADILVVAVGRPEMITAEHIKPGATVIDVGIHRKENGKLCGDVAFESAAAVAGKISPVPGGVGPMTVVSLIENTIKAAEMTV
jgi:methylenetetrahydrofolate dehydrogenase (NADP+)/methenyltetrahydrofolate cyclohydrolase